VASAASALPVIASHTAEVMTEPLPETDTGSISPRSFDYGRIDSIVRGKTVLAIGPGMGTHPETVSFIRRIVSEYDQPMVIDADGLNALDGPKFRGRPSMILTPHPGEMARLTGISTSDVLEDRVGVARSFATERGVVLVLKGQRTLVAMPDGRVWINPTGTPAMATGGTGDILTGLISGLIAQFPDEIETAVLAAVWLHGRAGEIGANDLGLQPLIATDLLTYLPEAIHGCADVSNGL
jgi:NAD(P)H-hydrate epimerase